MPADARTVRITTGLRAASQSIAWIGAAAGVFARHGLRVSFPRLEVGGPDSASGLMRGAWDFAQTGTVPIAEAVLNGGDGVVVLRNTAPHDEIVIAARPGITTLDELAGRKVGVLTDAWSGQAGVIVRRAIERAGARATYLGLGTYRGIHAALAAGEIDAGALPIDVRFVGDGTEGWTMFEASALPSVFATTRRMITVDRGRVLDVMRGVLEAIHLFKTRADIVVPLLQDFVGCSDRGAVERLRDHQAPLFPALPRPGLAAGLQEIRDVFVGRYPAARDLQEADIVDASLIEEIARSGFVEGLYGKKVIAAEAAQGPSVLNQPAFALRATAGSLRPWKSVAMSCAWRGLARQPKPRRGVGWWSRGGSNP
jgi:ABC-type nitrate/sulfonate/bicarbonate transport system substrate-binding protein